VHYVSGEGNQRANVLQHKMGHPCTPASAPTASMKRRTVAKAFDQEALLPGAAIYCQQFIA